MILPRATNPSLQKLFGRSTRRCDGARPTKGWNPITTRTRLRTYFALLLATAIVAITSQEAFALIFGDEGNRPIRAPGWPKGADVIFNVQSRIAYWVGPLGGHWHADCRGDAKALSAVLADFAKGRKGVRTLF